jgi:membrane protein
LGVVGTILAQVLRCALLVGLVVGALAIVYRLAPDRNAPKFVWTSPGAVIATILWVLGQRRVQPLRQQLRQLQQIYGASGVIVFLLWLYLTSYIILLGAEITPSPRSRQRWTPPW